MTKEEFKKRIDVDKELFKRAVNEIYDDIKIMKDSISRNPNDCNINEFTDAVGFIVEDAMKVVKEYRGYTDNSMVYYQLVMEEEE